MSRIPYARPSITQVEIEYVSDAITNGWGDRCYEYITKFETSFAAYAGTTSAIATSSATGALHLGLAALGIGPGQEVILADINWVATAAPIVHLGAKPVLVDILRDTWCVDPHAVRRAVTPRTRAIIGTHLYGNTCDMTALLEVGLEFNIPVIEDAAEGLGSRIENQHVGSLGVFGTFSFHGTKTLTTGEGGMFVTSDDGIYEKVLTLGNHGRARNDARKLWPTDIGYKFKMSNLQAALGCAQLTRIDELILEKRRIFFLYRELLGDLDGLSMNPEPTGTQNGFWMPTIVCDETLGVSSEMLLRSFDNNGIDGRPFFWPLSSTKLFGDQPSNQISYSVSGRAVNLPSFHQMKESEIEFVANVVRKTVKGVQQK